MHSPEQLRELAERCEKASGPDRALMCAAYKAAYPEVSSGAWDAIDTWDAGYDRFCAMLDTGAHLDAAMSLVPEGHLWFAMNAGGLAATKPDLTCASALVTPFENVSDVDPVEAATPALALCAAALRARAAIAALTESPIP